MAKSDSVAARLAQLQAAELQGQNDALSGAYDDGVASVPSTPGSFTQADIDSAVAAQKATDQSALDSVQAQLTSETTLEQADQATIAAKQAIIDQIKALLG